MIHYHGVPITPQDVAVRALTARHAFVSFAHPEQLEVLAGVVQTFALDNGAFSAWKAGHPTDWPAYYEWCADWLAHPSCDWAIIPDVIGGTPAENLALIEEWPHGHRGVPVWHMNEPIAHLVGIADQGWPRIAFGSAAQYDVQRNPTRCAERLDQAFAALGFADGCGPVKIHGLRMLGSRWRAWPFASADSTTVALNIGLDSAWTGWGSTATKSTRAAVLIDALESPRPLRLSHPVQPELFEVLA